MTALASEIGALTSDGVVISTDPFLGAAIKLVHIDAQPVGDPVETEMMFDDPAVAQTLLNEKWSFNRVPGVVHIGVELEENLGLGSAALPLTPVVPLFLAVDERTGLRATARLRSFGLDTHADRYPLELLG